LRVTLDYSILKDISKHKTAVNFLDILSKYRLTIDKIGEYEPINGLFTKETLLKFWQGRSLDGIYSSGGVLFKGQYSKKFIGMVDWAKGLPEYSSVVNFMFITISGVQVKDYDYIIKLGDELFDCFQAEHGYIAEYSQGGINLDSGNIYTSIDTLYWVNYFSKSYVNEPDFALIDGMVPLENGVRLKIADKPNDILLRDPGYIDKIKHAIGIEWFWDINKKITLKRPKFDNSEIIRTK